MAQPGKNMVPADSCPVCHEPVNRRESVNIGATVYYFDHWYYMMSRRCKGNFLRDPDRYIDQADDSVSKSRLPDTKLSSSHTDKGCCK